MAYTRTLDQILDSSIRNVIGKCASSEEAAEIVNEVTERLMRRGNFWGVEVLMRLCVYGCHIVWPRQVASVHGLSFRCAGIAQIKNNHWSIFGYRTCGWRGGAIAYDADTRPCYNEIAGNEGRYLKLHVVKIQDVGKTVRIFGFQYGNQPLSELDATGNWVPGLTIVATQAGAQTTVLVTKITSVIKEESQGRMFLYEVHPTSGGLRDLAMWEADETNPSYRCSVVQNWGSTGYHTDSNGQHVRQVEALVKLAFVPARSGSDLVMLDNRQALKFGIQGFRLSEADDDAGAEIKFGLAIKELNMELRDKSPASTTVVSVNSISSDYPICQPI